jgi:menaquinone-dependent protoporphyrinogen oxidase
MATLACSGLAVLGRQQPEVEFAESSCGTQGAARRKVLIAYASQYGSTGGVASAIARALCRAGAAVDVKLVTNVADLSGYQAVIVGSPVQNDAWRPEAISFVKTNREVLSRLPVAYFLTCMTLGLDPQPGGRERMAAVLSHVQEQIPEVTPVDTGLFAGTIPLGHLSSVIRGVYQVVGQEEGDFPGIDFRDWGAIRAWAESVYPL